MPTNVFEKLKNDKKKQMTTLAFNAFNTKRFHDMSILDISTSLGIKRTAFYYYFYDKEDFYNYLTDVIKYQFVNEYVYTQEEKVDLFKLISLLFEYLASLKNSNKEAFIIDLFKSIGVEQHNRLLSILIERNSNDSYYKFKGYDNLKMTNKEDIAVVTRFLFSIVYYQIIKYYDNNIDLETAIANVKRQLEYLKYGIIKEK